MLAAPQREHVPPRHRPDRSVRQAEGVEATEGVLLLGDVPDLPTGSNLPLECGGRPVVRSRNVMVKPHYATMLPPLLLAPEVELRWLRDGRLALYQRGAAG